MTKEELSLAMSYIDDAYIKDAYERRSRPRAFYFKVGALAASLLLVVGLAFPLFNMLMKDGIGGNLSGEVSDNEAGAPDLLYNPNSFINGTDGSIEYVSKKDGKITLRYIKTRNGYTHLYLDCFYEIDKDIKTYVATSDAFFDYAVKGYDGIFLDLIKIYVNGELSEIGYLPYDVGEYEIVIDLSELYAKDGVSADEMMLITGYGYISI